MRAVFPAYGRRILMAKYLDQNGLQRVISHLKEMLAGKQDQLTGSAGQMAGFDASGRLTAVDAPSGGVTQAYVDGLVGDIGTVLDQINGEAV